MTKNLNALAMLMTAIYLIAVVYHNKTDLLINFLSIQTNFVKWLIAFFILLVFYNITKSEVIKGFIFIAFIAMLLNASDNNMLNNLNTNIKTLLG